MRRALRTVSVCTTLVSVLALASYGEAGITPVGVPGIGGVVNVLIISGGSLNASGQVAFKDLVNRIYLYDDSSGLILVAQTGDPAPGAPPGVTISSPNDPVLNDAGGVFFSAGLAGPGVTSANDGALFGSDGSGGLTLLAREGDAAPGTGAAFGGSFLFLIQGTNGLGELVFVNPLTGAGVGPSNDVAVFFLDASGGLSLVAREGDPAPGLPAGIFLSGFPNALLSDVGAGLFASLTGPGVTVNVNDLALWRPDGAGGLVLVARTGDPAPGLGGVTLGSLGVAMSAAGEFALSARLGPSGICGSTPCDGAIFGPDGAGGLIPLVRVGDPAPGTSESFTAFQSVSINDASDVAFGAATNWEFGHIGAEGGVWATDGAGGLRLVARNGDPLPDVPGEFLDASYAPVELNNLGDVAIAGSTQPSFEGALFLAPASGGLVTALRGQDAIEVAPGDIRTILGFAGPPFSPGVRRFSNDARQVVFTGVLNWAPITGGVFRVDLYTDCVDGFDNDGDGFSDLQDPGCTSDADPSERARGAPCDDGVDNDGDGGADVGGDPACKFPNLPREDPQCQDGLNNDGQPGIDFDGGASVTGVPGPADPQCAGRPWWNQEAKSSTCGLGFESALVLLPIAWLRARRRRGA